MIDFVVVVGMWQDFAGAEMRTVAVAATQCGGGGENDVMPERDFQKLPSALSGYSLLHLSRPLILSFSKLLAKHIVIGILRDQPIMAYCFIINDLLELKLSSVVAGSGICLEKRTESLIFMELTGRETCMLFLSPSCTLTSLRLRLLSLFYFRAWSVSSKVRLARREIEESLVFVRILDG
ncbi:unnamed protein product [Sphenostylis stenocarpa]|uniref:Uncharacterized protein n=1 Tax=Sphenostylis stenocarpa TaxID=92480 RepID=A0AA86S5W2_9FABA|nr:unnamed protein product [Sphenostylis stenocarpa]